MVRLLCCKFVPLVDFTNEILIPIFIPPLRTRTIQEFCYFYKSNLFYILTHVYQNEKALRGFSAAAEPCPSMAKTNSPKKEQTQKKLTKFLHQAGNPALENPKGNSPQKKLWGEPPSDFTSRAFPFLMNFLLSIFFANPKPHVYRLIFAI